MDGRKDEKFCDIQLFIVVIFGILPSMFEMFE